jgi:LPS export ABC transporter protein LptC
MSFLPRCWRPRATLLGVIGVALVLLVAAPRLAAAEDVAEAARGLAGELRVRGMTFVGSRGDVTEFVLQAREAVLRPETNIAELQDVRVHGTETGRAESFEVSCERGELDVDTNDFLAEGDVHGTTGDGRRYAASWVRYDHARALLYTDAPATLEDATGTFRGDGFRYLLKEGRFRLVGNVKVVQQ